MNILFLSGVRNSWTPSDWEEHSLENEALIEALTERGHTVAQEWVSKSVAHALMQKSYHPNEWLVISGCDGYADRASSHVDVITEIESLGFAHLGSSANTLRLDNDKAQVRSMLLAQRVPMPFGVVVEPLQHFDWERYPAMVKPTNQHASIGITSASVVQDKRALWQQLEFVFDVFHAPALVEEFIAGREFTVTVFGNEELNCLPPLELDFGARNAESFPIYSYESKFISNAPQVTLRHPAALENFIQRKMAIVASAAFRALGCHDYARVDVRLRGDEVYVLDVNAYPALDAESAVSLCGRAAGMEYGELLDCLVMLAQARVKFH